MLIVPRWHYMLQLAAFTFCISTLCQSIPGHVLLLFQTCGGHIIGRLLHPILAVESRELMVRGLEDDTRGQLYGSWINMVSLGFIPR